MSVVSLIVLLSIHDDAHFAVWSRYCVRTVTLETMCVDKDWFDEDQLPGGTGVFAYLTPEVTTTPMGTSGTPTTLRITLLCLASVRRKMHLSLIFLEFLSEMDLEVLGLPSKISAERAVLRVLCRNLGGSARCECL